MLARQSVAKMSESKEPSQIDWTHSPWVHADLFFLQDALAHGMSISEIAGFLGKTEKEVRAKAKELSG
jgi:predicted transcriptional regulator